MAHTHIDDARVSVAHTPAPFPVATGPRGAVPGLSLAVVGPAGTRWAGGAGLADLATGAPAAAGTVYPWFSMTKLATATAVLQLCERGLLDLDAPVGAYYAPFRDLRPAEWAARATVRHLLSHSVGLANPLPIRWVRPTDAPALAPGPFIADLLARHGRLRSAPGARAAYSNLGYLVLGEVIAAVTGRPYQDYIRAHILAPLGMTRTDFAYSAAMAATAATGYHRRWDPMLPLLRALLPPRILAAPAGRFVAFHRFYVHGSAYGGLIGPVDEAARFLHAHLAAGQGRDNALLSPTSAARMQRLAQRGKGQDFGLGWFRRHAGSAGMPPFVEHLGGGAGFWTDMRLFPTRGLGLVVMGNATSYDHEAIGRHVLARWGGAALERAG
jgi:CubicO group peptidase (beta-lactamase class C family)